MADLNVAQGSAGFAHRYGEHLVGAGHLPLLDGEVPELLRVLNNLQLKAAPPRALLPAQHGQGRIWGKLFENA